MFFSLISLPLPNRSEVQRLGSEDIFRNGKILCEKFSDITIISPFNIPLLKVGTLDSLVEAGERLAEFDLDFKTTIKDIICATRKLLEIEKGDTISDMEAVLSETLKMEGNQSCQNYIMNKDGWRWNAMKYRSDRTLNEMSMVLEDERNHIDSFVRARMANHMEKRRKFDDFKLKNGDNLLESVLCFTKNDAEEFNVIMNPLEIENDDQYCSLMSTQALIIPKMDEKTFLNEYETSLCGMMVPRSARKIKENETHTLYIVTIFRKSIDEFMKNINTHKWIPKQWTIINDETTDTPSMIQDRMQRDLKADWNSLIRQLKINWSEIFGAWIHLKVITLFVESILLYGLPPIFMIGAIKIQSHNEYTSLRMKILKKLEILCIDGIDQNQLADILHDHHNPLDDISEEEKALLEALKNSTNNEGGGLKEKSLTDEPFVSIFIDLNFK